MKKFEINKKIIFVGFILYVIGITLGSITYDYSDIYDFLDLTFWNFLQLTSVSVLLGSFFIYAKNIVVQRIGYGLCAISGAMGLKILLWSAYNTGIMIACIGCILMLLGVIIVFITLILGLFGFTKTGASKTNDIISSLSAYNTLKAENVITEEEFSNLKQQALENCNGKSLSFADLKQWKKLLDQKIITADEFSSVKADLFKK